MGLTELLRPFLRQSNAPSPVPPIMNRASATAPYQSGSTSGPRGASWQPGNPSANVATANAPTIRARCRDAMRNDSWAANLVNAFVDDAIGWGIKPLSRAKDEAFRQKVQALWEDWSAVADADGVLDMAGLQALAVRTIVVDGECFVRLRTRLPQDQLPVPLQIQILPPDVVPEDDCSGQPESGNIIKRGIEYNAIGRPIAYWMRECPPGEDDWTHNSSAVHRVPASQVCHLFEPLRPGQRRGVSMLAPALVRLRELDLYDDATLLRLQLSNMFTATLTPNATTDDVSRDLLTGELATRGDGHEPSVLKLAPGAFQELQPGEKLDFNEPPDPPVGFEAFIKHELRAAGAAVGVPLEVFSHDWGATNDRLARVILNQYRRRVLRFVWSVVVPQFLRPVWNEWIRSAIFMSKALPTPTGDDAGGRVTFAQHAWPYVHPVQDVASTKEAIRSGLTSRASSVAETGEDVEAIDAAIAADNARADKLGLRFDSDSRNQKGGAQ